ncbi:helix-turn-helix domain-containing protein [Planktomarina sp.]|nr:helix-turn-helix domain-containing protein [Planktomarina sp.]
MDKRELSSTFRERFRSLLIDVQDDLPGFLRSAGIDRSALSQLRDPKQDRLPRAETLRRIAEATGVSVDWLLGLENSREGRQKMTASNELLSEDGQDGSSLLSRWHTEAEGHKLRYVPAGLPDMLSLPSTKSTSGAGSVEEVLTGFDLGEMDLEIAMPLQTFQAVAGRSGLWAQTSITEVTALLAHIREACDLHYPALRLHLFDGCQFFSAPFTVFGRMRASVYVGDAYMSVTGPEEVRYFSKRFDLLVRNAVITPDAVPAYLRKLLD